MNSSTTRAAVKFTDALASGARSLKAFVTVKHINVLIAEINTAEQVLKAQNAVTQAARDAVVASQNDALDALRNLNEVRTAVGDEIVALLFGKDAAASPGQPE